MIEQNEQNYEFDLEDLDEPQNTSGFLYCMIDTETQTIFPTQEYANDSVLKRMIGLTKIPPNIPEGVIQVWCVGKREMFDFKAIPPYMVWKNSSSIKVGVE